MSEAGRTDDGGTGAAPSGGGRVGLRQGSRGLAGVVRESAAAWRRGSPSERLALGAAGLTGAVLAAACLFGIVHVVGGAFHANPRAVGFGAWLSGITATLLGGLAWLVGRLVRGVGGA